MKRGTSTTPTRIYTYGCLPPVENGDVYAEQVRLSHVYRNKLVEIELARRAAVRAALTAIPEVAEVEARRATLTAELEAARGAVRAARAAAALKKKGKVKGRVVEAAVPPPAPIGPALAIDDRDRYLPPAPAPAPDRQVPIAWEASSGASGRAVSDIRKDLAVVYEALKAAKARAKEAAMPQIKAADSEASVKMKEARAASGLYWGTYLLVEKAIEQARGGRRDPKFRRWDGQGKSGVQLQNGLPAAGLADDRRIKIDPVREGTYQLRRHHRRLASRTFVNLRVGTGTRAGAREPVFARFPVIMHRPLPPDGLIKWAWVKRSRVGLDYRYELQLVVEAESFAARAPRGRGTAAINIGWRTRGPDLVRVAYLVDDDDRKEELVLPARIKGRLAFCEVLQSHADQHTDSIRGLVVAHTKTEAWVERAPEWLREGLASVAQWRSGRRFSDLAWKWKDLRWKGDEEIFAALDAFREKWRHLARWEAFQRRNALLARREFYRVFAARVASSYSRVVLADVDLRDFAEVGEDDPGSAAPGPVRATRHAVAPSELDGAIRGACRSRGVEIVEVKPSNMTVSCSRCGTIDDWDPKSTVDHRCSSCGVEWDQDENCCRNLLKAGVGQDDGEGEERAAG